jgi:hypothetical protein
MNRRKASSRRRAWLARAPSPAMARLASRLSAPDAQTAVDAASTSSRPQGRQERRLHPGARQGRSEPVRHRAGDRGRQGLHGRRLKTEVSIQSISKVFTMAQVIQEQGLDSIEKRIGVDATGARFNSIIAVEGVEPWSGPARRR